MANDDRRINRTRQLLSQAMLELLVEKGYDAITVQDIIDRANVGRSTFYAHFTDKENLLTGGLDRLFAGFDSEQPKPGTEPNFHQVNLDLLRHVHSHQAVYRALISKGSSQTIIKKVLAYFFQYIAGVLRKKSVIAETAERLNVPLEALIHHIAGAYLNLMEWWLNDDNLPYSAEELYAIFTKLTLRPLNLDTL